MSHVARYRYCTRHHHAVYDRHCSCRHFYVQLSYLLTLNSLSSFHSHPCIILVIVIIVIIDIIIFSVLIVGFVTVAVLSPIVAVPVSDVIIVGVIIVACRSLLLLYSHEHAGL